VEATSWVKEMSRRKEASSEEKDRIGGKAIISNDSKNLRLRFEVLAWKGNDNPNQLRKISLTAIQKKRKMSLGSLLKT